MVQLKSVMTSVYDINYVLPREGGNSPSVPSWEHVTRRGRMGGQERRREELGRDCQTAFQLPPPPHPAHPPAAATTSCPAGGRELMWGDALTETRLWHPFPAPFSSRVGPLPFAPGLALGTLALSLGHCSASAALDSSQSDFAFPSPNCDLKWNL